MNVSFLKSLVGLSSDDAEAKVRAAGHVADVIQSGLMRASIACPNTVILWLDENNHISSAEAGDPVELVEDMKVFKPL